MYVCLCKGITDRQIEQSVANGAASFQAVCNELGVSTQCGQCAQLARSIVNDSLQASSPTADYYDAVLACQ